ncbi:MAG: type IV toxin-antitoxin system AbiEi family antitoxin [Candidatus Euphemobacter frigidus]|nr:type IV toxin-antitoxin system AbiEi family antitoxin [Candidatus Euphemobacter frigidus]MDP8275060.1 type IV toxin-antitoxin system AbiEi family antitoxin [Candidatus Euphemobacter frigidus]
MNSRYTRDNLLGISKYHRELLSRLHRALSAPFGIDEAAATLELSRPKTRSLLCYWSSRGWLSRIRRGTYITVPLNASNPSEWREDPWIVANAIFSPCYIGGWSAAEHWGLTEQIFSDVVVFTSSPVRDRTPLIKGTKYVITAIPNKKLFSLSTVWRNSIKLSVSSPSRTIADILNTPRLGGGMKHAAEFVAEYFDSEHRDDNELRECLEKLNNRAAIKRLGYVIETLGINAPDTVMFCEKNISAGYSKLDPSASMRGKLLRRWNLEVNVNLRAGE